MSCPTGAKSVGTILLVFGVLSLIGGISSKKFTLIGSGILAILIGGYLLFC